MPHQLVQLAPPLPAQCHISVGRELLPTGIPHFTFWQLWGCSPVQTSHPAQLASSHCRAKLGGLERPLMAEPLIETRMGQMLAV